MNCLRNICLLVVFLWSVNGSKITADPDGPDVASALYFIKCTQKALRTGIKEIGLPSHDPLIIKESVEIPFDDNIVFYVNNMKMDDIPNWEVTQSDEYASDDPSIAAFDYTIYWKDVIFEAEWGLTRQNGTEKEEVLEGSLVIELDHLRFAGLFNLTIPGPDIDESLNDFSITISAEVTQVKFEGLGVLDDLIENSLGGVFNSVLVDGIKEQAVADGLKNKITVDWINKPERILAIIDNCAE